MDAPVVSIVAPAYNEARNLAAFVQAITPVLDRLGEPWEIVFVDDGSRDDTLGLLLAARPGAPRVKGVGLPRHSCNDVSHLVSSAARAIAAATSHCRPGSPMPAAAP